MSKAFFIGSVLMRGHYKMYLYSAVNVRMDSNCTTNLYLLEKLCLNNVAFNVQAGKSSSTKFVESL